MWAYLCNDHVMLSEEHLPELRSLTEIAYGLDGTFYVPRCFKAPYYYVGEKVAEPDSQFHSSSRGASAEEGTSARK